MISYTNLEPIKNQLIYMHLLVGPVVKLSKYNAE